AAEDRRPLFAAPNDEPALAVASGYNPYHVVERVPVAPVNASPYAAPNAALGGAAMAVMGGEVVYAGFWKRVAAYTIDGFVVGIPGFLLQMLIAGVMFGGMAALSSNRSEAVGTVAGVIGVLVMYLAPLALAATYFGVMHASSHQATLGKMAVGIKVTDEAGEPISFWRGFGRYFGLILSSIPIGIGLIMAGFTDRKRALHDMICSTLVVDRWAFTAHPERQRRELGAVTIVILCLVGLGTIAYVGLIAFALSLVASAGH
ncbi:RDD family protein, partial [Cognatilysobacter lacus]